MNEESKGDDKKKVANDTKTAEKAVTVKSLSA